MVRRLVGGKRQTEKERDDLNVDRCYIILNIGNYISSSERLEKTDKAQTLVNYIFSMYISAAVFPSI